MSSIVFLTVTGTAIALQQTSSIPLKDADILAQSPSTRDPWLRT